MILYFASDLLWASRIKATAEGIGLKARPVRSAEMLRARLEEAGRGEIEPVTCFLADLDDAATALELIRTVRAGGARIRVLAWGPHVARDALQAARDAGADEVMTRGGFDHDMENILLRLEGRG